MNKPTRKKIFVLLSRVPYPLIKGDKLRAFNQIKSLSENFDIYLCALSDIKTHPDAIKFLSPYCKDIRIIRLGKLSILWNLLWSFLFTKKPLQVGYFYQKQAQRKVTAFLEEVKPEHIYCQLIRTAEYIKKINSIPKTIDFMDSLSSGMERRMNKASGYFRWIFRLETYRLKRYEHQIFDHFNFQTIISERDRDLILNYKNKTITVVENGVDHDYFSPVNKSKEFDLLFTGNMSYPPNIEAVKFLILKIMPLIWERYPNANLVIAGANPSRKLKEYASERIIFTGWVKDIRDYYNQSKVFIAPMHIGSGLQNKLLEAMSMNLPCVTSELANKSLMAKENVEILIGRNAHEYAELALNLLKDEQLRNNIAGKGNQFVEDNFNWEKSIQKLNKIFESSN